MERLDVEDYMYNHFMDYDRIGPVITIGNEVFIYLDKDFVVDEFLALIIDPSEEDMAEMYSEKKPSYLFEFGGRLYTRPCDKWGDVIFTPFFNIGNEAVSDLQMDFINLGVHGRYELMNGTREYSEWCDKAKFFNQDALGICEKNTLAGTLAFQMDCNNKGIQPIIGETFRVDSTNGDYNIKLYAKNDRGWNRLLNMNRICNIENARYITESDMTKDNGEGLVCVMSPSKALNKDLVNRLKDAFDTVYFQIDLSEYDYEEKEMEALNSMKLWYNEFSNDIQPILINDCYYLEKEDARIKKELNKSGVKGEFASNNQHYKHVEELFLEWEELWDEDKKEDMISIFKRAVRNTSRLAAQCTFQINTKDIHLPKYEMTEEESKLYKDNDHMIDSLIEDGIKRLIKPNEKYTIEDFRKRIDYEMSVIRKGGFVDYFLITRDIINWANKNGIMTGIGRGSAAGCAVSYIIGIVLLNPLEYDLLFERFLNEGRLFNDVDMDGYEVTLSDGSTIDVPFNKKVIVNNKKILASELKEGDDFEFEL